MTGTERLRFLRRRGGRRRRLARGRAGAPPGPSLHARLPGPLLRRLRRAARRPGRGRRPGDRLRPGVVPRPDGGVRRAPEGARPEAARIPQLRDAPPRGLPQGDARVRAGRPARFPGGDPDRHARRLPGRGRRAARPVRRNRPLAAVADGAERPGRGLRDRRGQLRRRARDRRCRSRADAAAHHLHRDLAGGLRRHPLEGRRRGQAGGHGACARPRPPAWPWA